MNLDVYFNLFELEKLKIQKSLKEKSLKALDNNIDLDFYWNNNFEFSRKNPLIFPLCFYSFRSKKDLKIINIKRAKDKETNNFFILVEYNISRNSKLENLYFFCFDSGEAINRNIDFDLELKYSFLRFFEKFIIFPIRNFLLF